MRSIKQIDLDPEQKDYELQFACGHATVIRLSPLIATQIIAERGSLNSSKDCPACQAATGGRK